jgi:hypothetical protein
MASVDTQTRDRRPGILVLHKGTSALNFGTQRRVNAALRGDLPNVSQTSFLRELMRGAS